MGKKDQDSIRKIAVTGPESSGKSDLCRELAMHYQTIWVPEYARGYLENLGRRYTYEDLEYIARQQVALEQKMLAEAHRFLFCDTELINIRIWAEYRFKKCPEFVIQGIQDADYDLYLLCTPDIPWEPDPLRENRDDRDALFEIFRKHLENEKKKYRVISGLGTKRIEMAKKILDTELGFA